MNSGKLLLHIKKTNPNYKYSRNDFLLEDNGIDGPQLVSWDEQKLGPRPTAQELETIPEQELEELDKYKRAKTIITVVQSTDYVKDPVEGSMVYSLLTNAICIYSDGTWKRSKAFV